MLQSGAILSSSLPDILTLSQVRMRFWGALGIHLQLA